MLEKERERERDHTSLETNDGEVVLTATVPYIREARAEARPRAGTYGRAQEARRGENGRGRRGGMRQRAARRREAGAADASARRERRVSRRSGGEPSAEARDRQEPKGEAERGAKRDAAESRMSAGGAEGKRRGAERRQEAGAADANARRERRASQSSATTPARERRWVPAPGRRRCERSEARSGRRWVEWTGMPRRSRGRSPRRPRAASVEGRLAKPQCHGDDRGEEINSALAHDDGAVADGGMHAK